VDGIAGDFSRGFEQAYYRLKSKNGGLLIVDDGESLVQRRKINSDEETVRTTNTILSLLTRANDDRIMVVLTTNVSAIIDPAVTRTGRFSLKFYFQQSNKIAKKIISQISEKLDLDNIEAQILPLIEDGWLELADLTEIPSLYADFKQILNIPNQAVFNHVLDFLVHGKQFEKRYSL
jgi:SpoVK/Ycf46/Vps4 family AAA+-type ATPase